MRRNLSRTFFSFFLLLLLPLAVFAQSERGAIIGLITDSTGSLVPGANVTITNLGNKTSQTLTTNGEGRFEAPFLIPATYEVSAMAPGFGKTVNNNVVVNVGQRVSINLELRAGGVEETVQVIGAAPLLQTESASIGQVIDNKQLTELPSGDRNIYSFILLNSNVNQPPGGNGPAFRLESGGSFSISVYFPYSDWIIERWPNYFLPALDAFRVLGLPVDVLPYAPPLEESVYPYYPFHMNKDVLDRLLKEPTVLVLPNVSGFQQTDSDLIKGFVEQGGVVVAFGPEIPMGRSYERRELFGADEAGGMTKHAAVVLKDAVGERVKPGSRFALKETELPEWIINKARVIATFEDKSAAIIANRFGKGIVVSFFPDAWTAARDMPDLVRDVIDYALSSTGRESLVDIVGANESVDIAVGKTTRGFSVALVNHNSSKVEVILGPTKSQAGRVGDWVDLVVGNKIETAASDRSVKLTIQGNGFRALEFRRASTE